MKIRHKTLGVEFEVLEERITLLHVGGNFYETMGGSFISHRDPDWEKVEEWEDVTKSVLFTDTPVGFGALTIDGVHLTRDHYRLRKIDGIHTGPAFIIERRKP